MRRKTFRRRGVRYGLLASNVAVLAVISVIVLHNPHTTGVSSSPAVLSSSESEAAANPVDQLSSADIALTVARLNGLPETTAITNQAQSQAAEVATASTNDNVIAKPQVVATALKSRADIQAYTTQAGDTVASVAAKFGVTSDSIRWSNNIAGEGVPIGAKINIPPVNGIVYTVQAGDTADSLAAKFHANRDQIVAYNDGEISGLNPGEKIIIPNATQNGAATATTAAAISGSAFAWGGNAPIYGSNGYDYGYCTWYVATQIPVPANWGNASTWAYYAARSGWHVSSTPTVGSIAQRGGGEGHVGIVVGVNPDGSIVVRDMNGVAGWGRVGTSTKSPGVFQNYITH